jgi:MFS family permease
MALGQASEVAMLLLMPFILRRLSVKNILIMGLFAWSVRYMLLAWGNPYGGLWMFYLAILLHGLCYDFFFMTGQLYTDQEAPAHLRGAAQGMITLLTYGVGMLVGSLVSGRTLDHFTHSSGGVLSRNWQPFWIACALTAFLILLLVAVFFRTNSRIESSRPSTLET